MKWIVAGRSWPRWLTLGIVSMPLGACDGLISSNKAAFADEARVIVTGQSTVPLLIVTSTNFVSERDLLTGELVSQLIVADTFVASSLPQDRVYQTRGGDRFLVRLVNPDSTVTATIHMRLILDDDEVFNQRATMKNATLEYIAFFRP